MADTRRGEIVRAAIGLLEREGPDGLTMRAIAAQLGIRAPSLYKHVPDKAALELAMIAVGLEQFAVAFEEAVRDSTDPVRDLGRTYRAWGLAHPHLYRMLTDRPLPRADLPPGLEARAAMPLVRAFGGDVDLSRAAWALAHGLTSLELVGRFPPAADLEAAWDAGMGALRASLGSRS